MVWSHCPSAGYLSRQPRTLGVPLSQGCTPRKWQCWTWTPVATPGLKCLAKGSGLCPVGCALSDCGILLVGKELLSQPQGPCLTRFGELWATIHLHFLMLLREFSPVGESKITG
jgi:hypothetical protein